MAAKVYLITGCSTGLGRSYVQEVLDRGEIAVATARNPESLHGFTGANDGNFLSLRLDVTSKDDIERAFAATLEKFGRVDVVCNNAGYGLAGAVEEVDEAQARRQFDVNYWGLLSVTRRALEVMREQRPCGGLIQQVSSIGGQVGLPLLGIYCGSKWAVEALTESLHRELKPEWNIRLTCIEPGGFRTDWAGRNMVFPEKQHPAYRGHLEAKAFMASKNGTQTGDPAKAGRAMYRLANLTEPPPRAVIGSDAYRVVTAKLEAYGQNYARDDLREIALSCDFDE